MDTILIIPPINNFLVSAITAICNLIKTYEFAADWDEPENCEEDLHDNSPTRLYSREGSMDTIEKAMYIATQHKIPLAIHIDGSNDNATQEWNNKAYITWYDPTTDTRYEDPAGTMDVEPLIPLSLAAHAASNPTEAEKITSRVKTLQFLGIL